MNGMKVCVNTQTPLIILNRSQEQIASEYGWSDRPMSLHDLSEGRDYQFTTGGVTRMVLPLLRGWRRTGLVESIQWVSLNPSGPPIINADDGIELHHVSMEKDRIDGYGRARETMLNTFHGSNQTNELANEMLWQEEFSDYTYYNRRSAQKIMSLDAQNDFDLFYIHDFQQLPLGSMLTTLKPKVFRWHIPFDESTIPANWTEFLSTYLESYDSIIVSSKRYLKTLRRFGYQGHADYVYPYLDSTPYHKPKPAHVRQFRQKFGIRPDDIVVLMVARLDPLKGHDKAIIAAAEVLKVNPRVKLLLVGDGGFSSAKAGMGLSKGQVWSARLVKLAKQLQVSDRVVFAGYLSQDQLNAAYDTSSLTVLPSFREGFGLVVIESWLFRKPTIVTSRAGIAELITDGENGLLCDPDDPDGLASLIENVITDKKLARRLGEKGNATSKLCLIEKGIEAETNAISRLN